MYIMKKLVLIGFIVVAVSQFIIGQQKFVEGYILKNNDTLNCIVYPASLLNLQKKIIVTTDTSILDQTVYKPFDADEIHIHSLGSFKSKAIRYRLAKDVMMSNDYNADDEERFYEDSVFLKVLVTGRANLYLYKDKNLKEHYFIEKDSLLYELYEKKVFKYKSDPGDSRDKNRMLSVQKRYLGILSFIFSDNPKITQKQLLKLKCSKSALMKITHEYNLYFDKKSKMNTDEMIKSQFGF